MTKLIAFAGPSRSGKGTAARVIAEECAKLGLTTLERQLSDNGKWSLARIFRPTIGRVEAVAWFEELKSSHAWINMVSDRSTDGLSRQETISSVPLQKFLQHGLQEGGRDIFGADLWTDMIIPRVPPNGNMRWWMRDMWLEGFFDVESGSAPTDVAIISDLRQPNEAVRVRALHGLVVEMVRPPSADQYRTGADHITELRLPSDLVNHVIVNDGDVEALERVVRTVFYQHIEPWIRSGVDAQRSI